MSFDDELHIEAELRTNVELRREDADLLDAVTDVPAFRMRTGRCHLCNRLECCQHSHSLKWCEC